MRKKYVQVYGELRVSYCDVQAHHYGTRFTHDSWHNHDIDPVVSDGQVHLQFQEFMLKHKSVFNASHVDFPVGFRFY